MAARTADCSDRNDISALKTVQPDGKACCQYDGGHIMLKIIAGFIVALKVFGVVPLLFDSAIIAFEIFIAVLQAYIYTILSCIYLSDALHSH